MQYIPSIKVMDGLQISCWQSTQQVWLSAGCKPCKQLVAVTLTSYYTMLTSVFSRTKVHLPVTIQVPDITNT